MKNRVIHLAVLAVVSIPCADFTRADRRAVAKDVATHLEVANADFETSSASGAAHWRWWSRTGDGSAVRDTDRAASGEASARLEHDGPRDWVFENDTRFDVQPGTTLVATARAWVEKGHATLAVVGLRDGKTVRWNIGSQTARSTGKWMLLEAFVEVPSDCNQMYVRFVGEGDTRVWVDQIALKPWKPEKIVKPKVQGYAKVRVRERLDRGALVRVIEPGKIYVGWRLLESDAADVAFDVYRQTAGQAKPVKINAHPIRQTTDLIDDAAPRAGRVTYFVAMHGTAGAPRTAPTATVDAARTSGDYLAIDLEPKHTFQKVGIADLNGDGRLDFVIKGPNANIDPYGPYWKRSPDTYKLDAYDHSGRRLWRYDLGWAIERGIWYSPYLVYDFDGDGRAEVAVKTGQGDPREKDGRVREGAELLTILDGQSGRPIAQTDWPSREGFDGDRGYNLASRNQLTVAYLDGKTPCLVVERGTYGLIKLAAYQLHAGRLEELWRWDNRRLSRTYWGQGAHWMHVADVDGDGRDEVAIGSAMIDDDGTVLWTTGLGHPDHTYLGDLDPSRPGLEIYYGIETRQPRGGMCMVDAATGRILWQHETPTTHIHSSGLCSDVDARHAGWECYSGERDFADKRWLRDCRGNVLSTDNLGGLAPRAVYWDADPQRELLIGGRLFDYLDGRREQRPPRIEGYVAAVADILGDWREEIVTSVDGQMRIYTTTVPAGDRRVCLMRDPIYRIDVANAAMGYFQVPALERPPMVSTEPSGK